MQAQAPLLKSKTNSPGTQSAGNSRGENKYILQRMSALGVRANYEAISHLKKLLVTDTSYIEILKEMRSTIRSHDNGFHYSDYKIQRISSIKNLNLEKKHLAQKKLIMLEMNKGFVAQEMMLYHGTPYAHTIAQEGFRVKCSSGENKFGRGIYFASHSSNSNQYAWGNNHGCPLHNKRSCLICTRRMLICKCFMGKQFNATEHTGLVPPGYHSVIASPDVVPALIYPEFTVLHGEQAVPLFLVEYTIIP